MERCCVPSCGNSRDAKPGLTFHGFPPHGPVRRQWIAIMRLLHGAPRGWGWQPCCSSLVCSDHFLRCHFKKCRRSKKCRHSATFTLRPDAVPWVFHLGRDGPRDKHRPHRLAMSRYLAPRSQLDEKRSICSNKVICEEEHSKPTSDFRNKKIRIAREKGPIVLKCQQCEIIFNKRGEFETHLLSHVRVPIILVKRLSDLYIARVIAGTQKSIKKVTKNCVARKHTQSYVIQKDLLYEPLKLILKVTDSNTQGGISSELAPNKVLIGPGDCAVKKEENLEQEGGGVAGLVYNKDRVEDEEKTSGPEEALCEQGSDSGSEEEDGQAVLPGASKETLETLETLRRLGVVRLPGPRKRSSSIVSAAPPSGPPSPTPSELLGPEFLAPERPSCPPTPVMVEKSPVDDERSRSPAFHSKENSRSSDENSDANDQQEVDEHSPTSKQKHDEDSNESNYSWNDGTSNFDEGVGNEVSESMEERDPLFLPEQSPTEDNDDISNDESSVSGYETVSVRGDDSQSDKESKPKNLPSAESLGLNTEFISLERLGDSSNVCSVCNEKFPDRNSLSKHKAQAGHFQCGHGGCGIVCGSVDELNVHQEMAHGQGAADMKPLQAKHPPVTPHQGPQIHPKPLSNLVQQPVSPRAPCPSSLPIQQTGVQKRTAPSNGDTSPSSKQRRLDMLLPDKHDDADCHVIALQKRTESGPVIGNVEGLVNSPDSMIHLPESITLSVRQPPNNSPSVPPAGGSKGKSDPKAVANILATRGITVVPSGGGTNRGQSSPQRPTTQRPAVQQPPTQTSVAALNLNSAISIIPAAAAAASPQQPAAARQTAPNSPGSFAVPQGRSPLSRQQQQQVVDRPPRPPTVDLTQDAPVPARRAMQQPPTAQFMSRGRARGRPVTGRHTCQICSKVFSTPENLTAHMALHRSPGKLPFRCNNCPAQYPTQHGLLIHQQACRRDPPRQQSSMMPQVVEMAVPLINMKIPGLMNRLRSLGVTNYISYSQFINMPGNHVGLPIVTVDGSRLPALNNITQIGATAVISFGPIKPLPR